MRKYMFYLFMAIAMVSVVCACSKKDDDAPITTTPKPTPKPNLTDTIARGWVVKEATHNGSPDGSSVGLTMNFNKDGSYLLVSTGYTGTWKFIDNETKVLLDENEPQYKTTWTIASMSSSAMEVSFKSPFTGGNATWKMEAK